MRKFLTFFLTALLAFGVGWAGEVTDEITWSGFGIQSISYSSFSNVSFLSDALYSGRVAAKASGGPIQLNANANSQNGIFTTQSGGKVKSVTVTFNSATNSGNYVDIYGKNTAYTQISDLYTSSEQGTVIASPRMADSNLTQSFNITDDYNYIAIRSRTKAVYIDKITIVWETEGGDTPGDPLIEVSPDPLSFNDEGGTISVNAYNMPDNGLGVSVTDGFTRELLSPGVNAPNYYFPLTDHDIENAKTKVTYTGNELIANGTITFASGNESKSAALNYLSDIYIVNNHGDDSWNFNEGVKMTYSDGVYTGTITATNPNTKIVFARLLGNDVNWNTRLVFGADSYGDWVYGTNTSGNLKLSDDIAIEFPQAGAYTITIDPVAKTFSITSTGVYNIAQAQAFQGDTFTYMGSARATYQHGQNLWIRDSQGNSGLIHGNVGTFANGDSLAIGWTAENAMYNFVIPQFENPRGVTNAGNNGKVDPFTLTTIELTDINKYASLSNVTITRVDGQNYYFEVNGNEYILRDNYYELDALEKDHVYNVVGVVSAYNGAAQLYLISAEDVTPKVLTVTLESETTSATAGNEIPVTVVVENAEGAYTVTYKIGENGTETTLTDGNVINVTSETAGEVTLYVTVTNNGSTATANETYTFTEPVQPGSNVFTKVTSADQLVAGKRYIFVYGNWAMGTEATGSFLTPIEITAGDVVEVGDDVAILTLGGTTSNYTFALGDNYLHAVNSTSLDFGEETKWVITQESNGANDTGFRAKLSGQNRAVKKHNSLARFGNYSTNDNNSSYAWLYVETASTPEPDPMTIELTAAPEEAYTVGDNVTVTATVEHGSENTVVTYKINNGEEQTYAAPGIVLPNTAAGDIVVTVKATDGNNVATDTVTYHFNAAEAFAITLTATPAQETYEVGTTVNVKVNVENAIGENLTITYTIGETRANETYDPATGINITSATADTVPLTVNVADGYQHAGESTATASYVFVKKTMGLAFEPTSVEVYAGQEVTEPALKNLPEGLSVAYSSSNAAVASVDAEGNVTAAAPGEAIITAKFAGNNVYEADSASYTITVKAKEIASLSFNVEGITVYPNAENFDQPVLSTVPDNLPVTYSSDDDDIATVVNGELIIGEKIGTATITAKFNGNDTYGEAAASYTVTVEPRPIVVANENVEFTLYVGETDSKTIDLAGENLKGNVTLTLNDDTGFFTIDPTTIAKADAENATVTVTYAPTTEGIHEATVTISTPDALNDVTVTLTGMATVRPVAAKPTFSPVPGSYTSAQTVTIGCETPGATIRYTVNGETTEATAPVTITLNDDATIEAVAIVNGMTDSEVAAGQYVIDLPTTLPDVSPFKGYYRIKNNGNNKFANIQGRKTLTFTNDTDKQAGTVIWLETNNKGQVQSLRSQAADLQGYADRAMRYVPEFVELAINKLHADGVGQILGEHGYDEIMKKFNASFDHHLYVEEAQGGYRIYGKTPSMQPVVDFYREHTNQVEAKLPMLEGFINQAIDKVLEKTNGKGASILQHFSVRETWQRMNNAYLTEPVDSASTMAFYREVLNNKNYVWSFAYETAMTYWERLKSNQTFIDNKDKLGEFAQYLDKIEDVRPDFKYYIVQENDKPDYVSEGNKDIKDNAARTIWTLEERNTFTVNIPEENLMGCELDPKYATTLYTDFAYTLPEGVKAYAVTHVTTTGVIETNEIEGTIAAQTPVLLKADNAGDVVLTLSLTNGTPVDENLLVGADYLIDQYKLTTPQVESVFNIVKDLMGETFYNNYVAKYEHLMYKNSGTVNNKYFWALPQSDIEKCVYINDNDEGDCVVRTLSANNGTLAFNNEWRSPRTNEAFLVSTEFAAIGLYQKGDVNHDGAVDVQDVTLTISYILGAELNSYFCTKCADADNDSVIDVNDVTTIIAIILHH